MSGKIVGAVDQVEPRTLAGWAYVDQDPRPAEVVVYVNGVERARAVADRPRPAAAQGQAAARACGFVAELADGPDIKPSDELVVRVLGSETELSFAAATGRTRHAPAVVERLELVRPPMPARRSHIEIFGDALHALFLREVYSRYGAFRFGYAWAVIQPLLFVVMINESRTLLGGGNQHIYGVSGFFFFMIGVLPFFMYQQGFHQAMGAMGSFRGIFNYREVRPIDIIFVRCCIEFALLGLVLMLLMFGLSWFGQPVEVEDPLGFLAAIALLFIFTQGMGLTADVYGTRNPDTRRVFALIDRPLFFISAVFFTVEVVPTDLRPYVMWNPLLHAIDLGRGAVLVEYESPCSWLYLSLWSFGLLLFGLGAYRRNLHLLTA